MSDDEPEESTEPTGREDPFEDLSADVGDREGDPFENLDDPDGGRDTRDDDIEEDVGWHPPGGPGPEPADKTGSVAESSGVSGPDAEPDRDRTDDPFESPDSAFERVELGDVDPEEVWEELSAAQARGSVAEARKRTYAEVSKHRFCEQCEYFSGPPEVACTHEGTEILEFPDVEHVRVVDCPVVAERQALEDE